MPFSTIEDIVKINVKVIPTPGEDKKYKKYIDIYRELFSALNDIYKKISA